MNFRTGSSGSGTSRLWGDRPPPLTALTLKYELNRFRTLEKAPPPIGNESRELARAGFYLNGNNQVVCYVCGITYPGPGGGDPLAVHIVLNSNCSFIQGTAENVPVVDPCRQRTDAVREATRPFWNRNSSNQGRQNPTQSGEARIPEHSRNGVHNEAEQPESMDVPMAEAFQELSVPPCPNLRSMGSSIAAAAGPSSAPASNRVPASGSRPGPGPRISRQDVLQKVKRELIRFRTFRTWTSSAADPVALAKAGFFYYNDADKVQCAFCLGIVGNWEPTDDPFAEHRKHFGQCPFVKGMPVGNVPYDHSTETEQGESGRLLVAALRNYRRHIPAARDPISPDVRVNAVTERGQGPQNHPANSGVRVHVNPGNRIEDLGIQPRPAPATPALATFEARLDTFKTWPPGLPQKPRSMVEAGLYYTGVSDEVKCFQCDGGLRGWDPTDEPWEEHALWYPKCTHVILRKGQSFVDEVRRKKELPLETRIALAEEMMKKEPAISAVGLGLKPEDVKRAIVVQLKEDRRGFLDVQPLIKAVFAMNKSRQEGSEDPSKESGYSSQTSSSATNREVKNEPSAGPSHEPAVEGAAAASPAPASVPPPAPAPAPASAPVVPAEENMETLCKICMERKVAILILPCGHLCSCDICCSSLKDCPICRRPFKGYVRAFLS